MWQYCMCWNASSHGLETVSPKHFPKWLMCQQKCTWWCLVVHLHLCEARQSINSTHNYLPWLIYFQQPIFCHSPPPHLVPCWWGIFLRSCICPCSTTLTEMGGETLIECYSAFTWDGKKCTAVVIWVEWASMENSIVLIGSFFLAIDTGMGERGRAYKDPFTLFPLSLRTPFVCWLCWLFVFYCYIKGGLSHFRWATILCLNFLCIL